MIRLRPMSEDEFPGYLEYFIPDYAEEIAANYRLPLNDALLRAKQEIAEDLPEGVNTAGHILLCLMQGTDDKEKPVGYLWYKPDTVMRTVFIYDFHIFSPCQGQGLGKLALQALEQRLRKQNVTQIRLRVAGDNVRAQHVYKMCGFDVTGINMSKTISD